MANTQLPLSPFCFHDGDRQWPHYHRQVYVRLITLVCITPWKATPSASVDFDEHRVRSSTQCGCLNTTNLNRNYDSNEFGHGHSFRKTPRNSHRPYSTSISTKELLYRVYPHLTWTKPSQTLRRKHNHVHCTEARVSTSITTMDNTQAAFLNRSTTRGG